MRPDHETLDIPLEFRPADSIRHSLESDAWRRFPGFAARQARFRGRRQSARRSLRWQDRALLILGILLMGLLLIRVETARAQDHGWGLELATATGVNTQLAMHTRITVDVTGLIARVAVTQEFANRGQEWAEGIYRFPLPDGAAVDRLLVQVGERIIEGEIQEQQFARRVYQQARDEGRTATLVERHRPNQYESRLANIGPGEKILVTIGFLVNVTYSDGAFGLRLPMTFTPRWDAGGVIPPAPHPVLVSRDARSDHNLQMDIRLRTGVPFAAIESRYHDVDIQPEPDGYRVTLLRADAGPDRDFELTWFPDLTASPRPALMTWDGGDAIYALLMLVPPLAGSVGPQPREMVFIIDTSGSMEGQSLEQAKSALLRGLGQLDGQDSFNLIRFNTAAERLFDESLPATPLNVQLAARYIDELVANGGTVMAPALESAFTLREQPGLLRQVVFITDGSVNNEHELLLLIGNLLGESRLFTVGIGSAPNSWFMRKAAEIGRGSHTHIGKLEEVEERMSGLWVNIRLPALSDICVDWGQDAEFYPEIIPDLYAGEPLWLVARMPLQPYDIQLCGTLDGRHWETELDPLPTAGGETLATLWARRKIESLEDSVVFGSDPDAIRAQVTRVALDHGLLTRETSLVAVDRTPVRAPDDHLATGLIPSLLPAGSTGNVAGFPQTATGWIAQLLLSLLTLSLAAGMYILSGTRLPLVKGVRALFTGKKGSDPFYRRASPGAAS